MAKKVIRKPTLADDVRSSLHEARDHASGRRTKAITHRVIPRDTKARAARLKLGVTRRG
jgi:hypothetical protein